MELRLVGVASMLLLSGCWQYLEPGVFRSIDGQHVPDEFSLNNQAPSFYLDDYPTAFRIAVLESSRDQLGLAILQYHYDESSYREWFDYTRFGEEGEPPNFVLCERRQSQFVCKADENGQAIFGRVHSHDGFTLFGSGSESPEGTVINDRMISFTYEFKRLDDISGGKDQWGDDIFSQRDWERLQQDFDDWMNP